MQLIKAQAGLTNYYHNQVIRNPLMDIDSTIIDQLTEENLGGGISGSSLVKAAIHSGGLNAVATGYANIQGGWNESKGLMKLDFITQDSPVNVEYLHVIGYVTNNSAEFGLSTDAVFTPVMSWKTHETTTGSLDLNNPTRVQRVIGGRTDYLLNDGSGMGSMITLRPSDVIDYSIERASQEDILNRIEDEGMNGMVPTVTVAGSDISRTGVIASKRSNINSTNYAMELLKAGTGYQRDNNISSNLMDAHGENLGIFDDQFNQLSNMAAKAHNAEPQMLRDEFFATMMNELGMTMMRGFNGYSIADLMVPFYNLNEVLDLTFMDKSQFETADFTLNTEALGTSNLGEMISHEITMNIMDLMLKYSLTAISFRGSNCDNFGGDGGYSNIAILPYNPASLKDDDYQLGNNVEAFVEDLTNQIFTKLNGLRPHELVPIRFDVTAELFGTCTVNIMNVDDTNIGMGFSMNDTGIPMGMNSRSFPTYAVNNFSAVLGDKEQAQIQGANFYTNLETYFK